MRELFRFAGAARHSVAAAGAADGGAALPEGGGGRRRSAGQPRLHSQQAGQHRRSHSGIHYLLVVKS